MWPLQTHLANSIWHTTHPERLPSIIDGGLKSTPGIPESERWKSQTPEFYPFVRKLCGVSLFDLRNFDPDVYDQSHPMSSWRTFVPHRTDWGGAVWIEIDYEALGSRFIPADELVERWNDGGFHRHTIMPRIECGCVGEVPVSAFRAAFITWSGGDVVRRFSIEKFDQGGYDALLCEWREAMSI